MLCPEIDSVVLQFDDNVRMIMKFILGFVIFGIALDMKFLDFKVVTKSPIPIVVGLAVQLMLFPALTFVFVYFLGTAICPSMALGMLLVASCPGGNMSNFFTHMAGGNTALSVTMSAISTMLAVICTPLNFWFWSQQTAATAAVYNDVSISFLDMFFTVMVLLGVPMLLGLLISEYAPKVAEKAKKPMRYFSILFFAALIIGALAANLSSFLKAIGHIAILVAVHNAVALAIGYWAARAARQPQRNCRTISIEVGIQNSGLGLILFFEYFNAPGSALGGMVVITAWWGIWHIVSGLSLATFWARRPAL